MTKPRFLKTTDFSIKACVPTKMFVFPTIKFSWSNFLSFCFVDPVNKPTDRFNLLAYLLILWKCCSARTSVGAINATCPKPSIAINIHIKATIVFPLPTSPCINLFICLPEDISL